MRNCPICKSESSFSFETEFVKVNRCENENCEHLFAVDSKPFQGVHEIKNDQQKDYSKFQRRNLHLIRYLKKANFIKPGYHIMDFGSGTGHLLHSLLEHVQDIKITAVEYNELYHDNLKKMGCDVYKEITDIPENIKFDAITFVEVLEHLDDPLEHLIHFRERLKPGKKLFVTTPAGDFRKKYDDPPKKLLSAYNTHGHVQFFTEKSFRLCFKKAGFKHIRYKYINALYPNREYETLGAKMQTLKGYYTYWRGYNNHLTYLIS